MEIKDLSLKELHALAQEKLGARAAELRTRQQLIDALTPRERKKPAAVLVALAPPLPEPEAKPLPPELYVPEPAPVPKITAEPFAPAETITKDFFLDPDVPRLPDAYGDDRVLIFARDPSTLYAAWDIAPARFAAGSQGHVTNAAGDPVRTFDLPAAVGGVFLEQLPSGIALDVEVLGTHAQVTMPLPPRSIDRPDVGSDVR